MKILVLSARDVHGLLPFRECTDVMRGVLEAVARGEVHQPLRTVVQPPGAAGLMALMPAYASGEEAAYGLKAICITPGNPAIGMDTHQGGVLLFAAETGEPLALVNASAITEVRTAAVSAVATELLACPDAAEFAVIGNGVQARAHVLALSASRPLSAVWVAGRDPARAKAFAAQLAGEVGDYLFAMREGVVGPADIRAEIGEVLTGAAPGRADDHEITLFKSLGLAAEDLAAASHVYSKAKGQGAGTWAEF